MITVRLPEPLREHHPAVMTMNATSLAEIIDTLGIDEASLPVIWDADFLYGPRDQAGADTYVLCEINVSSCFAIPDQAPAAIARTVVKRLELAQDVGTARRHN